MTCKARTSAAPRRRKNINVIRVIIGSTTLELATTGGFRLSYVGFLRGPSNGLDSPTEITLSMRSSCLRSYLARDYISSQIWISLTKPIRVLSPNRGFPYRLSSPSSCKVADLAEEGRTPGHFIPARLRLPGVKRNGRGPATPSVHQPSLPLSSLSIYLVADDRRDHRPRLGRPSLGRPGLTQSWSTKTQCRSSVGGRLCLSSFPIRGSKADHRPHPLLSDLLPPVAYHTSTEHKTFPAEL